MWYKYPTTKIIKPPGVPGEFKCRTCETSWLSFMENNVPCIDTTTRYGLHNFDFSKPILAEISGKAYELTKIPIN